MILPEDQPLTAVFIASPSLDLLFWVATPESKIQERTLDMRLKATRLDTA